ncbi:LPXTG cell wall anchor domain-containing protein [Microbacterium enclense]|uniref:LPXTG-motif cell wall anchor domain-containing protein/MYXO-CTERM domain-containing protein n=1 Tax=Microbacterium enclense TaxID=993073 RepID=A0A1G6GT65_9MICO|nr:LPXTG cell wall anchor domain-containing protein [Microbacterium enclense]KSU55907.1 hypothetical protein AS029_02055 [Microbacterium enclense]SDB85111.1 LPXTG-motif cell wall anchor domain-containing protein/MYXO-CTERM domain-containing protein [Microbacterium enclense]
MIRVGSRLLALAGGVLLGATLSSMPASAATTSPLSADVTVTSDDTATVSDVRWELPADAAPGDVVTLALPEHAGAAAGADWIASTGVSIGVVRLDDTGTAVIELTEAAADPANRRGEMVVRSVLEESAPTIVSSASTADAVLRPGEVPGPFFGAPDRSRGNKYGAWTDETETRARWVLEAPRGPWDTLDIVDRPVGGQRVDCTAGVRVRAAGETDPATGYLVDPVDVPTERVSVACDESGVSVRVQPVGDEIVEVTVETVPDAASSELANAADFAAQRSEPGDAIRTVSFVPRLGVAPSPTPTLPPVVETPRPGLPDRLAETGTDAAPPAFIGAVLLLAGAAAAVRRRRTRSRA